MSPLTRKEQDLLITSVEKDYGKLIMRSNRCEDDKTIRNGLLELIEQIELMASDRYFEDDNVDFLCSISESIKTKANL